MRLPTNLVGKLFIFTEYAVILLFLPNKLVQYPIISTEVGMVYLPIRRTLFLIVTKVVGTLSNIHQKDWHSTLRLAYVLPIPSQPPVTTATLSNVLDLLLMQAKMSEESSTSTVRFLRLRQNNCFYFVVVFVVSER